MWGVDLGGGGGGGWELLKMVAFLFVFVMFIVFLSKRVGRRNGGRTAATYRSNSSSINSINNDGRATGGWGV